MSQNDNNIISELRSKFGESVIIYEQKTKDDIPTIWIDKNSLLTLLKYLKYEIAFPYKMLYDLTGIDERTRTRRDGQPASDFSVVYHLTSFERNQDIRIKVALKEQRHKYSKHNNCLGISKLV